jgi:hypothetical protein
MYLFCTLEKANLVWISGGRKESKLTIHRISPVFFVSSMAHFSHKKKECFLSFCWLLKHESNPNSSFSCSHIHLFHPPIFRHLFSFPLFTRNAILVKRVMNEMITFEIWSSYQQKVLFLLVAKIIHSWLSLLYSHGWNIVDVFKLLKTLQWRVFI